MGDNLQKLSTMKHHYFPLSNLFQRKIPPIFLVSFILNNAATWRIKNSGFFIYGSMARGAVTRRNKCVTSQPK